MTRVDLQEAQNHLLELIEQAVDGDEIVITRKGIPVARLVAASSVSRLNTGKRPFGSAKGLITIKDDFDAPLEDFAEYQ